MIGILAAIAALGAAGATPPPPRAYFNDYAGMVRPATARALDSELQQFERDTSSQILVAIYPKLPPGAEVGDYTVKTAQAWRVGQKARDNGAVLFVFRDEHQLYIQTGYGLEGALPDAICKRIIEDEIVPRFRQGDFDGGMTAGVSAMLAAARGEYRGTGQTVGERGRGGNHGIPGLFSFFFFIAVIVWSFFRSRRHVVYGAGGRSGAWGGGPWIFPGGGGGGFSGGGGGGGGFSGGGGSFGGGGAGGSW